MLALGKISDLASHISTGSVLKWDGPLLLHGGVDAATREIHCSTTCPVQYPAQLTRGKQIITNYNSEQRWLICDTDHVNLQYQSHQHQSHQNLFDCDVSKNYLKNGLVLKTYLLFSSPPKHNILSIASK